MLEAVANRANRQYTLPQLKKRKIETTSSMTTTAKTFLKQDLIDDKRRRKSDDNESLKPILLPQKKRVIPTSSSNSPVKKNQKISPQNFPMDESIADENLIRETEAALKNLSGSWPGPRGLPSKKQEEPAFENLFDENKANLKMSPSSSSNSSTDNASSSLKDVITLRDQHDEDEKSSDKNIRGRLKIDDVATCKTKPDGSLYKPPDFNELVDDSSNELEIDMSEAASEKNYGKDDQNESKFKTEKNIDDSISRKSYHNFTKPNQTSPFSSSSAFRPPQPTKGTNLANLGPFPAEATFVGYPTAIGVGVPSPLSEEKPPVLKPAEVTSETASNKSPEGANKQYTILQPATAGSRAASALQEASREGVTRVTAVSGSSTNVSTESGGKAVTVTTVGGALSPNSIGREGAKCPTPGCTGQGHVTGLYSHHRR